MNYAITVANKLKHTKNTNAICISLNTHMHSHLCVVAEVFTTQMETLKLTAHALHAIISG